MANYLSQPFEKTDVSSTFNVALADKALAIQQGKYDANKAQIDQTLAIYKNQLKGLRDIDNEYIATRIKEVQNKIQSFGTIDYSSNASTSTILANINEVTEDPIVKSAVINKAKKDRFDLEVDELRKKDPKRYSDMNYQYSLWRGGFEDYMKGESKSIGSLDFVDYTDVTKEELDRIKLIKDVKGKREVEFLSNDGVTPSPDGMYKIKKSIDGLTDTEISKYIESTMSPTVRQQLVVNGWAKYRNNTDGAVANYKRFNEAKTTQLEGKIENYKVLRDAQTTSTEQKEKYSALIKDAEQQVENIKTEVTPNLESIFYTLESANFVNGLSQMAQAEWSMSVESNDVYFKIKDLEIKYEELALKRAKEQREVSKEQKEFADISVSTQSKEIAEEIDGVYNLQQDHDKNYNDILSTTKSFMSEASEADKKAFVASLKLHGLDENFNWDDNDKRKNSSKTATIVKAFNESGMQKYKPTAQKLDQLLTNKQSIAKDILEVSQKGFRETFEKDPDKYIESLKTTASITSMAGIDTPNMQGGFNSALSGGLDARLLNAKIENFVKQAGGWGNIKNYLKSNPQKLVEFAELSDEADTTWKGLQQALKVLPDGRVINATTSFVTTLNPMNLIPLFNSRGSKSSDINLKEDANKVINEEILKRSKDGSLLTMSAYNTVNITGELNKQIVNTIDQNRMQGELFDVKQTITYSKEGENIIMTQAKGASGYKAGELLGSKQARVELQPGDAGYDRVQEIISLEEGKKRGYDAKSTSANFAPKKPKFISTSDEIELSNWNSIITGLDLKSSQGTPLFGSMNPTAYITEATTKEVFEGYLKNKFGEQEVKDFSESYLNRVKNFTVTPVRKDVFINGTQQKMWALEMKNDKGKVIKVSNTGMSTMSEDLKYSIDNFPQMFITHEILINLMSTKETDKLNTILDAGI